jgi:Xaa-Pro aminopeptidase
MPFDYSARVGRLQAQMAAQGVEVTLLSVGADLPYFTGYEAMPSERLTVLVVPPSGEPVLFLPELEAPRVDPGSFEVRPWGETAEPVELAASVVAGPSTVAVGDHMWAAFLTRFMKEWPHASWRPASEITSELRMRKDDEEIELLRSAAHGASPHHHAGDRVIERGDLVVCDYGGRWEGYYSDSTRTFVVGEPTGEQLAVHTAVLGANDAGRRAVAPGVKCQDIDRAARAVIDDAGYGEFFIHRTGHGIGLEVHEHPYMVEGNDQPLEPGMTFSVEPGIYLPDRFGVRIEDIVVCTDNGIESLNQSDRGLLAVG